MLITGQNLLQESRDLAIIKQAKSDVQQHLKERTGLRVVFPDSGRTTTSENVCQLSKVVV